MRFDDVIRRCLHFDAIIRLMTAIVFTFYCDYQGNEKLKRTCTLYDSSRFPSEQSLCPNSRSSPNYTIGAVARQIFRMPRGAGAAWRSVAEDSRVTK